MVRLWAQATRLNDLLITRRRWFTASGWEVGNSNCRSWNWCHFIFRAYWQRREKSLSKQTPVKKPQKGIALRKQTFSLSPMWCVLWELGHSSGGRERELLVLAWYHKEAVGKLDLSVLGDDNQFTQTSASLECCLLTHTPITTPQCQEVIPAHPLCKAI